MLSSRGQEPLQAIGGVGLGLIPDPFSIWVARRILADGAEPAFGAALDVRCERSGVMIMERAYPRLG